MKARQFVRSALGLAVLALVVSALQPTAASDKSGAGAITTLYACDPLEGSLDFRTGQSGLVVQDGEVRNRDSHLCLGYAPDSLAVAIQGGDTGAIVDLGALTEVASATATPIVGNGGNAFVALSAAWARARTEKLDLAAVAHAPVRSGHVYLARIASEGDPDILVKLLVLEFRPGESVTFRWRRLED